MKIKQDDLAGADLGKYDDVDIFGLDEFGEATGLPAIYGAMIGSGAGTVAAIGVRSIKPEWAGYSELIGLGVGVAAGGAMAFWPGGHLRHAGWVAMAAAVLNNGLRSAEAYFKGLMGTGLRGAMVENVPRAAGLQGAGLGLIQAEPLSGPGRQAMLLGAPMRNPLSSSYGATSVR